MGRRGRGDGSLFYDSARECWVGQVDLGYDPVTGRRRRPKVSAPTKTQCREKLDELRSEKRKTGTVAPRDITVAMAVRSFMAAPPAEWRSQITADTYRCHAERITAGLGRVKLVALTADDVERFLRGLVTASKDSPAYSAATVSRVRGLLRRVIRRAERDGLVGRNVAALADLPEGARRTSRALTMAQIGALLSLDLTPWWRAYITTGISAGLRPGELLGLRWEDVDFTANVIRVRQSLKQKRGSDGRWVHYLDDLKTERSKRTLEMPREVAAALKAQRAAQAAERLKGGPSWNGWGLVFCTSEGSPSWRQGVRRGFWRKCKAAGLPGDWFPHEMRHTFVSVLSHHGVDIEDIADAAGHVNSSVTRTVYRHDIADKVTKAATAMDQIFGRVSGS